MAGGFWAWNTYGDKISEAMGWGDPKDWEPGLATGEAMVTISEGDTGQPVSTALFEAGVTRTEDVFYDYLLKENPTATFYPGVYRLQKKMTAADALAALQNPENKLENTVSVTEGGTIASILPGISDTLGFPIEELQAAVADPTVYGVQAQSLEGWLFPAVYTFDPDVTSAQVIQRMVDRTRESLTAAGVPDADAERILTIASIIQREGRTSDFAKVSRVIQNRLDIGMKLQMSQLVLQGAELKMVRMLRYETTSIAQIAWINADYGPMALCISPVDEKTTASLRQEQRHSMNLVWWHDAGYQFVLIGRNPPSQLRGNAEQLQRLISG